jgi:hypothetical protein
MEYKPAWRRAAIAAVLCTLFSLTTVAAAADKKEVVQQAQAAYYSLRDRGLVEFQANVQPNWRLVLKDQLAANPAGAESALKMLNGIHFTVLMNPEGVVKVTHKADVAPVGQQAAEGFQQIFSGMEQAMSGFFDSWKPFMLTSPLPDPASNYLLEDLGNQYHLSYKDGTANIDTTMSKDLVISEIKVDSPEFKSVLRPRFGKSAQGLLLTGYDATYQGAEGGTAVQLNVQIENQSVNGLQLPHNLNLSGSYQGTPFNMELAFSGYQIKNR